MVTYIGETAETFKKRCGAHYTTFNNIAYKNDTALAKHIWELQKKNITYQIHWEIIEHANSFKPGNAYCRLCITEKKWIAYHEGENRLNTNDELISTCRHRRKYMLGRIKNLDGVDLLRHTAESFNEPDMENEVEVSTPRRSTRTRKNSVMLTDFILN